VKHYVGCVFLSPPYIVKPDAPHTFKKDYVMARRLTDIVNIIERLFGQKHIIQKVEAHGPCTNIHELKKFYRFIK
jgi:hypothetical protein